VAEVITVEIPLRTVSEMNIRGHWAAKAVRVKRHRQTTHWALLTTVKPALPCTVTLTRIAPRALDGDNLQASFKATRDGVADWLQVDDRDPRVTWRYGQRRGMSKQYAVEVCIESIGGST
jgi:hypothetical protein